MNAAPVNIVAESKKLVEMIKKYDISSDSLFV